MNERRLLAVMAVADVVLWSIFAVLVVVNRPTTAPPVAVTSAVTSSSPDSAETVAFVMPSGNVACTMTSDDVICVIKDATFTVATGCGSTAGHVVVLDSDGVSTPCEENRDVDFEVEVLDYGSVAIAGDFTCQSDRDGVTCTDGDGVGFQLSRAALAMLR